MTTKILTGSYSGYALASPVAILSIASSGYVGGSGITVAYGGATYTIINDHAIRNTVTGGASSNNAISGFGGQVNVTNGSATDTLALIEGTDAGVAVYGGTINNFGRIIGQSAVRGAIYDTRAVITNGSATDPNAIIEGGEGIQMATGTVTNLGLILASGTTVTYGITPARPDAGIFVDNYATITNGSATSKTSLIQGYDGVEFSEASTLVNFGTIQSNAFPVSPADGGGIGVLMSGGGVVTIGAASDQAALIQGRTEGLVIRGAAGTVTSFGTIEGVDSGLALYEGGTVTNGAANDLAALITGSNGVAGAGAAVTIGNFGTIIGGAGSTYGAGVSVSYGATVTNGSATDTNAIIRGIDGVVIRGAAGKVTNFAGIVGDGGYHSIGVIFDYGGALTNGSSGDTAAGIYGYGGGVSVSGGAATLVNDGDIVSVTGYGVSIADGGRLTNGAANVETAYIQGGGGLILADAGTVSNFGTIEGEGQGDWGVRLQDTGCRLTNGSAKDQSALVAGYNGVLVAVGAAVTNFGIINGEIAVNLQGSTSSLLAEAGSAVEGVILNAGRVDVIAGVATVTGGLVNYGMVLGAGTLALTGGTSQFYGGSALSVDKIAVSGSGTVVDFEANVGDGKAWTQTAGTIEVAAGSKATFSGTGDSFSGVAFTGAGALAFTAGTDALVGDTLAVASVTFGAAKVTLSGVTSIATPVINTGTLTVASGTLTASGAVTGAGTVAIASGVADFTSTFTENVTFSSTTGVLELAKSQAYAGTVTGFSKTGTNSLDLGDITFGAGTKATYSGTTTSGTLTVTDGTHTAKIKLSGNYTTSTFRVSSDGHGGTKVVDPSAPATHAPSSPLLFTDAMAGFGARAGGLAEVGHLTDQHPVQTLVRNHAA